MGPNYRQQHNISGSESGWRATALKRGRDLVFYVGFPAAALSAWLGLLALGFVGFGVSLYIHQNAVHWQVVAALATALLTVVFGLLALLQRKHCWLQRLYGLLFLIFLVLAMSFGGWLDWLGLYRAILVVLSLAVACLLTYITARLRRSR